MIAAVRGGVLRLPEGARVFHTLTHVDNLVRAAEPALHGPVGIYNMGDATDVPLDAVLREFLAKRGMAARAHPAQCRTGSPIARPASPSCSPGPCAASLRLTRATP